MRVCLALGDYPWRIQNFRVGGGGRAYEYLGRGCAHLFRKIYLKFRAEIIHVGAKFALG